MSEFTKELGKDIMTTLQPAMEISSDPILTVNPSLPTNIEQPSKAFIKLDNPTSVPISQNIIHDYIPTSVKTTVATQTSGFPKSALTKKVSFQQDIPLLHSSQSVLPPTARIVDISKMPVKLSTHTLYFTIILLCIGIAIFYLGKKH